MGFVIPTAPGEAEGGSRTARSRLHPTPQRGLSGAREPRLWSAGHGLGPAPRVGQDRPPTTGRTGCPWGVRIRPFVATMR